MKSDYDLVTIPNKKRTVTWSNDKIGQFNSQATIYLSIRVCM